MEQLENEIVEHIREAIANLGKDQFVAGEKMRKAHEIFSDHLMEWSDDFCRLYNGMLSIYRSYTPAKSGHYRSCHHEIGYSSFATQRWVQDRQQATVPTTSELLVKFDSLVNEN